MLLALYGGDNIYIFFPAAVIIYSLLVLSLIIFHVQNQSGSILWFSPSEEESRGARGLQGKYLFSHLCVELQTSVQLIRKLSPTREQREQTVPHHGVCLTARPCLLVCSNSRHDRRRERWDTRKLVNGEDRKRG